MNIEEVLKDIVKPCDCKDCDGITGYIYKIVGSNIYLSKRPPLSTNVWIGCPLSSGRKITFEEAFENLDSQIQLKLIYHLDFFR
jgi:hypothetical protein